MRCYHRLFCRITFILIFSISCTATSVSSDTRSQLTGKQDLLPSVINKAFENLPEHESLKDWIGAYDQTLATDLAGSEWYIVDIPTMQTSDNLWLGLNTIGFLNNLVVILANPASGKAKVYFETDLFGDASFFQDSYWLKLNQETTLAPTKIFVARAFRNATFNIRNLELLTGSKKASYESNLDIFAGVVFGALLALLAYNLALAFQLHSPLHAFYSAYCLSNILFVAWNNRGLGFQADWYESYGITPNNIRYSIIWVYIAMSILFIIRFLEPVYRGGIQVKSISLSIVATLVVVFSGHFFSSSTFLIQVFNGFVILILIQILTIVLLSWRHGSTNAPNIFLAFIPIVIIGILRITIDQHGIFLHNGIQIGSVFEMLILSWALTERVRQVRDAALKVKGNAERKEREIIIRLNKDLESQVADRTRDLEESRRQLLIQRDEALKQSKTDPLTGLKNRGYLTQELEPLIQLSVRHNYRLSLIMLDIDHFKKINDTLGHQIGDEILKAFADTAKKETRSSDMIVRFGGDEFIVVLPETALDMAQKTAEKLRNAVSEMKIPILEEKHITVSLGVAELNRGVDNMESLIAHADTALYKAKAKGRNRVCLAKTT